MGEILCLAVPGVDLSPVVELVFPWLDNVQAEDVVVVAQDVELYF